MVVVAISDIALASIFWWLNMKLLILVIICSMQTSYGFYQYLFNNDRQGFIYYQQQNYQAAYDKFSHNHWRGLAALQNKNYKLAITHLIKEKSLAAQYNLGNAYALNGDYEEAIKQYEAVLAVDSNQQDAAYNLQLLQKLLQQQNQQQDAKANKNNEKSQQSPSDMQPEQQANNDNSSNTNNSDQHNSTGKPNNSNDNNQQANNDNSQAAKSSDRNEQANHNDPSKVSNSLQDDLNAATPQMHNVDNGADSASDKEVAEPNGKYEKLEANVENKYNSQQTSEYSEQQQTDNYWLRSIPDEPGSLLKQKFLRDHLRRQE